jgi:uncharacterized protein (TIGR03790 family)
MLFALILSHCPHFCGTAHAGGSGLNVLVVVNQASSNSVQLGNYYCEARQVPPLNLVRINWTGPNNQWTTNDLKTYLITPLLSALSSRQLTNQVDYVVLSMDIPYRVVSSSPEPNSTTAGVFYGYKEDVNAPCSLASGSTSLYAGSEGIFRSTPPLSAPGSYFLTMMITSSNLAQAKQFVDRGVAGDSTFPSQPVYLAKSSDVNRNVRYATFDTAVFDSRLRGYPTLIRTNTDYYWTLGSCSGCQGGVYNSSIPNTTFTPGAMADNLTSYGGLLFEDNSFQMRTLDFLLAGATASYGTVTEPCNYLEKFPSPENFFYQSRGFSIAECYYLSLTNPYQGILVGEPLSAPFQKPASGAWSGLPLNSILTGTTNLTVQFNASDPAHPVQQVDLFVDGVWSQTITNIPPTSGNILYATLNGFPTNYPVPANATIRSVVSNLTSRLNFSTYAAATKITAAAHGDRIELQSTDMSKSGSQVSVVVSNSVGTASTLTSFISASAGTCLDTVANGIRGWEVVGNPVSLGYLGVTVNTTNGTIITMSVTNISGQTLLQMLQALSDLIRTNASPSLQGPDGLALEDIAQVAVTPTQDIAFNLRALSPGWNAAQIQATMFGSSEFNVTPAPASRLDENISDLHPRNHLYVTAGVTNLPLTFPLNTTTLANGYHDLTAVVYEGSHVHTQRRVTQTVRVQNNPLSATFTTLVGDTNSAIESTLQFQVIANTNPISKIELFSTGGSLGGVLGFSNATISVACTNLGIGLHSFYAVVTAGSGAKYKTESKLIRIIGSDSPFTVALSNPARTLSWPATAGRSYDVLSTPNLSNAFTVRYTLVPSNAAGAWTETDTSAPQRFYRVRTSN